MREAIGAILPFAVWVALSPVPIIAVVLMLAAPVGIYVAMGDRAREILGGLRDWMGRHNAAIMTVLLLVIGAKLIGDGIATV